MPQEDLVLGPLSCSLSTQRRQTLVPTSYALPSSGLHLSLSESSCPLCLDCATLLGTTKAHCHVQPPPGCGKPLRHTGAFCCSWELCEAISGPCAWMCPVNNVHFCSRTCHNPRRSGSSRSLPTPGRRPVWATHLSSHFPCVSSLPAH